jgi:hypothetical protein
MVRKPREVDRSRFRSEAAYRKAVEKYNRQLDEWRVQQATIERNRAARQRPSTWTPAASQPPQVGTIADTDDVVSFKTGGPNGDDTLIADGDDNEGFDRGEHDHYGQWGGTDRGYYSGPGS